MRFTPIKSRNADGHRVVIFTHHCRLFKHCREVTLRAFPTFIMQSAHGGGRCSLLETYSWHVHLCDTHSGHPSFIISLCYLTSSMIMTFFRTAFIPVASSPFVSVTLSGYTPAVYVSFSIYLSRFLHFCRFFLSLSAHIFFAIVFFSSGMLKM